MTSSASAALAQLRLFPESRQTPPADGGLGIERSFDIPFVARLALKEKQIQQNYRPVIAVHKWFARRPGTLFRALLLSEFSASPLTETFYQPHDFAGLHVADPFMGGGTPLLEANRLGCDVTGWDINPMAYWIVGQEIRHLDIAEYRQAADEIASFLEREIGSYYLTKCAICQRRDASVKYHLWVKTLPCRSCSYSIDLFPGYLLAAAGRHPLDVLVCASCGELNEVEDRHAPEECRACGQDLRLEGPARRGRCECPACGETNAYPVSKNGPPAHRMFALEYHCWHCKRSHRGRFFKKADRGDLASYAQAAKRWGRSRPRFVPDDGIPRGDETDRLHRWGYHFYREMFNERQLLGLELLCRRIARKTQARVRHALATNLSDLLRYQNLLCRYDTSALKSLDVFSVHGFPVGLVQAESNLLGIRHPSTGVNVGSGGWSNIVEKFSRAKAYCNAPFEIEVLNGRKVSIPVSGEWIGEQREKDGIKEFRRVDLRCESATQARSTPRSLDAVLTDPPYFANVQYAELMDFCYVWLRRLVNGDDSAFISASTRNPDELTGNATMERDLEHFTAGLSEVFVRMAGALKDGAPLAFTYHHNRLDAYSPVAVAILDAQLACSASLPCPAEMGGSIHIHSTSSSIVDTVFVCRATGAVKRRWLVDTPEELVRLVYSELEQLRMGGVCVTQGDARCIAFGHVIRMAIWKLRKRWDPSASWIDKLERIKCAISVSDIVEELINKQVRQTSRRGSELREATVEYDSGNDEEVSF